MTSEKLNQLFQDELKHGGEVNYPELDETIKILSGALNVGKSVSAALYMGLIGNLKLYAHSIKTMLAIMYIIGRKAAIEELTHIMDSEVEK